MTHQITLLESVPLTHDTRLYTFDKPEGYVFQPGQATDLAIDSDGWRDEERPFTFVSDPAMPVLSFVIKSYPEHGGVTEKLSDLDPGATARIGDAWGAIEDKGPGTFIAGGAGITPFLGILRARARDGTLEGCHLIYANDRPEDIILHPLWEGLEELRTTYVVAERAGHGHRTGRIDAQLLDDTVTDWDKPFYLCGPPPMEDAVAEILRARGVPDDRVVRES
jgi:ferredoxin-NADP reductase